MPMITVPARLLAMPEVSIIYRDADFCVLRKRLVRSTFDRHSYTNMHVLITIHSGEQHIVAEDGPVTVVTPGNPLMLRRGLYSVSDLVPGSGKLFDAFLIYFSGRALSHRPELRSDSAGGSPATRQEIIQLLEGHPDLDTVLRAPRRQDPLSVLEKHFDKPFTIDDLAYLSGMSVSTMQREFRRRTGKSPRAWIVHRRLAEARRLLRVARRPDIAAIAIAVGYRNVSHFISRYRAVYGRTPLTDYRHFSNQVSRS